MKRLLLAVALLIGIPAQAAPRWLTYVPRQVGRTYANMFTFKRPVLALEQWASIGAAVFDEKTTMDAFARCHRCVEAGYFDHGERYGVGTTALNVALAGTLYATSEEISADGLRSNPSRFWRNIPNVLFVAPVTIHVMAGVSNMGIKGDPPTPAAIFPAR